MFVNPFLFLALPLGAACFLFGWNAARRVTRPGARLTLGLLFLALCLPAASFIAYYLHLFGEPAWYIEFRALPGIEATSALAALWFGFLAGVWRTSRRTRALLLLIAAGTVLAPFVKPLLLPAEWQGRLQNTWEGEICRQSSNSTCGPATLATILTHLGIPATERGIARQSYSCASGTELWYLIRYARAQGVRVTLRNGMALEEVPAPALLGTRPGAFGHFVAYLGTQGDQLIIGDPMAGKEVLTLREFRAQYAGGCVVTFER
jgi:hypothetical protein